VQVGKLDAVVPDTLLFLFNAVKTSSGLINAELNLEEVEIRALCQQCHNEFEIDLPLFICPACGSGQVKVLQGRGIILQRIIADETQGVEVGNSSNS
jgi:hydrogenase nickel incorporation protein HypA/HybF